MKNSILLSLGLVCMMGFTAQAQVSVVTVEPAPSSNSYDPVTNYEIMVYANQGITTFGEATISYNDTELTLEKGLYAGTNGAPGAEGLQLKISYPGLPVNYVKQAMEAGANSFTVKITDVMCGDEPVAESSLDNPYIEVNNGTITLEYGLSAPAVYLADDSVWPATFYKYWAPGEMGSVAIMVFDQPVKEVYEANVIMAHAEPSSPLPDGVEVYPLTPIIDGDTISFDLAGVERDSSRSEVTIQVTTVTGENGLPADMGGGSPVFTLYLPYSAQEVGGVAGIATDANQANTIYNLNGVKVNSEKPQPGIYIINGKKVVVK
ncbi:MAG: hypothetical protein J1F16_01420 [Muribaculaceae bacterium]|nr:hypothetical protein [Muribaculaceae bacterium]